MTSDVLAAIGTLLRNERVLSVAVAVGGEPVAALLPFAVSHDFTALFVQASGLARHTQGLLHGAPVGVLVHAAATPDRDPMQIPRLTVRAIVEHVARDTEAFVTAAARLVNRFPAMATTLALEDFNLYALRLERGRYVQGFAQAFNVGPDTFRQIGPDAPE